MEQIRIQAEGYADIMREKVEPFLAGIRQEGFFAAKDGLRIHYEMYVRPDSRGGVVISHGFTESAEKFREVVYRFYAEGYSVFVIDHRGHGQSGRLVEPWFLTHVDNFADYVEDFEQFVDNVAAPRCEGRPLYLFGHSMGGAIAALALMRRPERYARAVLNAPMIQARTNGIPLRLAQVMGRVLCAVGMSRRVMFGFAKEFDPDERFETSCSANVERFRYYQAKRRAVPHLRNCSPTIGWVRNAMDVTDVLLDPAGAGAVSCPVLLLQAETDGSVINEAQDAFIRMVPKGELLQVAGSKHEIFMSDDAVLEGYYAKIFAFLKEAEQ